jgi:fucose 4-O-acetylase-like acetyltransferase
MKFIFIIFPIKFMKIIFATNQKSYKNINELYSNPINKICQFSNNSHDISNHFSNISLLFIEMISMSQILPNKFFRKSGKSIWYVLHTSDCPLNFLNFQKQLNFKKIIIKN